MARKMVCDWGMSKAFGPVAFGNHDTTTAPGEGGTAGKNFSDETAVEIDGEIRSIVTTAYNEVRDLLRCNMVSLNLLVEDLVVKETLNSTEIDAIIQLKPANR